MRRIQHQIPNNNKRARKIRIIVDLRRIIEEHMQRKALYGFFSKFSLQDLITTVLSIDPYIDYSQHIYDALEMRFEDDDIWMDMDLFVIFYETLISDIDSAVVEQYAIEFDEIHKSSYIIERWIDRSSVLLRVE